MGLSASCGHVVWFFGGYVADLASCVLQVIRVSNSIGGIMPIAEWRRLWL